MAVYSHKRKKIRFPKRLRKRTRTVRRTRQKKRSMMAKVMKMVSVPRSRGRFGFPSSKVVRMRWDGYWNSSSMSTSLFNKLDAVVRLNYPYDPWHKATGAFNQVSAGYTLYSKLYGKCTVLGAKLVSILRMNNVKTTANTSGVSGACSTTADYNWPPMRFGVITSDSSSTSYLSYIGACDDPATKSKTFCPSANGTSKCVVVTKLSPRKFFGFVDPTEDELSFPTGAPTTPVRTAYAIPFLQSLDQSTDHDCKWWGIEYHLTMLVRMSEMLPIGYLNSADALIQG